MLKKNYLDSFCYCSLGFWVAWLPESVSACGCWRWPDGACDHAAWPAPFPLLQVFGALCVASSFKNTEGSCSALCVAELLTQQQPDASREGDALEASLDSLDLAGTAQTRSLNLGVASPPECWHPAGPAC